MIHRLLRPEAVLAEDVASVAAGEPDKAREAGHRDEPPQRELLYKARPRLKLEIQSPVLCIGSLVVWKSILQTLTETLICNRDLTCSRIGG